MEVPAPAPVPQTPARQPVGWWVWLFLFFFLVLAGSRAYFALHAEPPAPYLAAERSTLVARADGTTEARIVVGHVPWNGQVRLTTKEPGPDGLWRVLVQWDQGRHVEGEGDERTLSVVLPAVDEIEVVDQRGPVHEVARLHLVPGAR